MGYNNIHKFPTTDITLTENVVLLDLSYNYIKTITRSIFSHYPSITDLNLAGNRLTTVPSVDEWKIINSLEVLELSGNNFTCNCSGSQLKETLVSLNARIKVKDLNQIKCSFPSAVKGKVIYNLSDSLFGCPFVNLVLILTLTLSLLLSISVCMFIASSSDTTSICFCLYILDGDFVILTQKMRLCMMLSYLIPPKTVIG